MSAMSEQEPPRTRLAQLLRQQHVTLEEFRKNYQRAAKGTALSQRQAYRWVAGQLRGLPYPQAQATLEKMFGEPVARLLGPPYGIDALAPSRRHHEVAPPRGSARTDWKGQVIAMSADRARDFLTRIEASNVGAETLAQLTDDLRRLVIAYEHQPLPTLLGDLVDTQDRAFVLLEERQRPEQTRDLYLIAGIACGLMAKASHDLGAAHDAMTQARTGYACADNAGHDGLRAWIRGLQSLITYWSGRLEESVRYAQSGADAAVRSHGTAGVWLASNEARALAALHRLDDAHAALTRAADARDRLQPDELDSLGGLCTFSQPRQLYYAADALSWGGQAEANHTGAPRAGRAGRLRRGTGPGPGIRRSGRHPQRAGHRPGVPRQDRRRCRSACPGAPAPCRPAHSRHRDLGGACPHHVAFRRQPRPRGHRVGWRD
jgi:hypothetical protein